MANSSDSAKIEETAKTIEETAKTIEYNFAKDINEINKNAKTLISAINLNLETDEPPEFSTKLNDLINRDKYLARVQEKGLINEKTGSSVAVRNNGQINMSASLYSQYKINPNGKIYEQSLESEVKTNRRIINTNDIVINGHKMNPALWELTNFKEVDLPYTEKVIIGDFTMKGSVLVKAWEPNLKRYMLIRRPCRMKPFGELLNVPEINTGIDILDPLKIDEEILALTDKGYQVNALITDSKSRIGKEGENRGSEFGTGTTFMDGTGGIGTISEYNGQVISCSANAEEMFKALRGFGYTDVVACGILGNLQQESGLRPEAENESGYKGIAQWDPESRWPSLLLFAKEKNKNPMDVGTQLSFLYYEATTTRYPEECCPSAMNKKCPDVATAVYEWLKWFEGALGQEEGYRQSYAKQFYDKFKGK